MYGGNRHMHFDIPRTFGQGATHLYTEKLFTTCLFAHHLDKKSHDFKQAIM